MADTTRRIFLSAFRTAISIDGPPPPPFGYELKLSARQQFEYMLETDEYAAQITTDDEFRKEVTSSFPTIFSAFISSMTSHADASTTPVDDIEWVFSVLPKMSLVHDFVLTWHTLSPEILRVVWGDFRERVVGISGKILEAVGQGEVFVPAGVRVGLLRRWVPFMREMKETLGTGVIEEEVWERIEGAIVSLLTGLPSGDQAQVFREWIGSWAREGAFPDLSDAFQIWCYRCKSAWRKVYSISSVHS